jgi:Flp pilus assembly protein TadG
MFALVMMFILLGIGALVLDLGRMFVAKGELQNAADACALAAASQLRPSTSDPNALTRAVAYGRSMTRTDLAVPASYRNLVGFQKATVTIDPDQVTFSNTDLATTSFHTIAGGAALNSQYAKCEATFTVPMLLRPVADVFIGAAGGSTRQVYAMAVATLGGSQTSCAVPLGLCKGPGSTAATNWGHTPGEWIVAKECTGSCAFGTGNFGWLDFTPPAGGASELSGWIQGGGYCGAAIGDPVGQQGTIASLSVPWNSRFGLYKSGTAVDNAPPDFTGYGYGTVWKNGAANPAVPNAYSGTSGPRPNFQAARAAYTPYQGGTPQGFSGSSSATHLASGKNRRIVTSPVIDCTVWNSDPSGNPAIEGFACVLLLEPIFSPPGQIAIEYLGVPGAISECPTSGLSNGANGNQVPVLVQ